tara:strand:+ start:3036 stop:3875 length:840 start_codon:yes stop_codon:yes gene_type:complete
MDLVFPLKDININDLKPFMLLKSNIIDFNNNDNITNNKNNESLLVEDFFYNKQMNKELSSENYKEMLKNKNTRYKNLQIDSNNYFWPREKDQLFWCFYVSIYGKDMYYDNKRKTFTIEHDMKIQSIEKLRKLKDELKIHKIRRNLVEDELLNSKKITTLGLHALCLLYKKNILLVKKRTFIKFSHDLDNMEYKLENYNVIFIDDDKYYIDYELNNDKFLNIVNEYFHLENIEKPLKSPSSYSLKDLQNIATKLNLVLQNTNGKNLTKNQLYENILQKLT